VTLSSIYREANIFAAYTITTATQFNGFSSTYDTLYVNSETMPDY
jgi:hypothetical protein